MDLFIPLLSSIFMFIIVVGANHGSSESQVYWRTLLPHTPMPSIIEQLLQSGGDGPDGVAIKHTIGKYYYAASDAQLHDDPAVAFFFRRQDLRAGKKFTLQLDDKAAFATAAFIPRSEVESVPFSTAELPSILSRFSMPVGSAEAAAMEKTLSDCEVAPLAGETKWCATSLESMVDFATTSIGTREVVALATEGGAAGGARQAYKVGSVRRVMAAGGKGVVLCHLEAYAYAVFFCHATETTEVYEVEMAAAESGGTAMKAVAVCHTDTAGWNPNHLAFKVLKVKPGTVPVCHFLPRDIVVWAGKV